MKESLRERIEDVVEGSDSPKLLLQSSPYVIANDLHLHLSRKKL